jgi:hypothetical protein
LGRLRGAQVKTRAKSRTERHRSSCRMRPLSRSATAPRGAIESIDHRPSTLCSHRTIHRQLFDMLMTRTHHLFRCGFRRRHSCHFLAFSALRNPACRPSEPQNTFLGTTGCFRRRSLPANHRSRADKSRVRTTAL